jgi:hypothetical protein
MGVVVVVGAATEVVVAVVAEAVLMALAVAVAVDIHRRVVVTDRMSMAYMLTLPRVPSNLFIAEQT